MYSDLIDCVVVGLGVGEQHAKAILQNTNCSLSRIVELDSKKAINFIENNSLKDVQLSSFEDAINDSKVQLLSLASFDDHHYQQVIAALNKDKHVFVEKPLCQNKEQLNEIYSIWRKTEAGLASNLVLRTAPLYIYVKQLIEQGQFGEIYAFDADYLYGRIEKITDGWRKDVNNYSVMQGGGIHMIDLMLWLTAQKPKAVKSENNKIATKNSNFMYPDFHSSTFIFESGLIGRVTANFGCVHRHQHVVRVFGTKATFIFDDMGARIHWSRDPNSIPEIIQDAPKPKEKGLLINELVQAIKMQNMNHLAQREFDLMSTVLAADEALINHTQLDIEYLI